MTSRERILAALAAQPVDRVPWVPLCSQTYFWSLPGYQRRFMPRWEGSLWPSPSGSWEDELRFRVGFFRDIGADFMSWGEFGGLFSRTVHRQIEGVETVERREGDLVITETRTPVGALRRVARWVPEAFTGYTVEHPLKGPAEWRVQEYLLEHTAPRADNEQAHRALQIIGEDGVALVGMPGSPMMGWLMGEFSIDGVSYGLADHPKELLSLERKQHRHNLEVCRLLAQNPAKIMCTMAVYGTAMVSPTMVRHHYVPQLREYTQILRAAGKFVLSHASGEPVGGILEMIPDTGLTGLYGIRQWPAPNAPGVVEVKRALGEGFAVCGGLDGDFLYRSSPARIKDATRRLLEAMAGRRGFILATADDTPYGAPPSHLEAVSEAVREFGS